VYSHVCPSKRVRASPRTAGEERFDLPRWIRGIKPRSSVTGPAGRPSWNDLAVSRRQAMGGATASVDHAPPQRGTRALDRHPPPDLFVPDSQFPRVCRSGRFRPPEPTWRRTDHFPRAAIRQKLATGGGVVEWPSVIPPGTFGLGNTLAGMRSRAPTQQTPTFASSGAGGAARWSSTAASTSRVWWRRLRFGVGHRMVVSPWSGRVGCDPRNPRRCTRQSRRQPSRSEPARRPAAASSARQWDDVLSPVCELPCGQLKWLGFCYDAAAGALHIRSMCQRE